eukprot:scaffold14875_cov71-Skeletonema_dohrnii-CCMP3373.AAC.3
MPKPCVNNIPSAGDKKRKEVSVAATNESSPPKKKYRYECRVDDCTNHAQKGGVCIRHGATVKQCSVGNCTNNALKGGVCHRHGAQRNLCSREGCTNHAKKGGLCRRHGAMHNRCSVVECNHKVVKGGVCVRHGAKVERKLCSVGDCTNIRVKGGVCWRHGAAYAPPPAQANFLCGDIQGGGNQNNASTVVEISDNEGEGRINLQLLLENERQMLANNSQREASDDAEEDGQGEFVQEIPGKKDAIVDGQNDELDKSTSGEECKLKAEKGGVCITHGICQPTAKKKRKEVDLAANNESGPPKKRVKKRCSVGECTNQAQKGGVCWRHGARKKVKLCSVEECTNYTVKGGVCTKHGANGDRCKFEGCTVKGDFNGFCGYHQEPRPNNYYYNRQIQQQQQQLLLHHHQQQQQQILCMGLASTMSSLGYRFHPPQWNNNYNNDNSFLNSNRASLCNFEGCNIIAIHGRFCWRHSASSFAPRAHADIQRGYVQGGGNQIAPTEIIIIDAEEAGEKKLEGLITSRKRKEGVAKQSKSPPSCDTGEHCPDESEQDGRGHRCAVEDSQNDGSDKSLAAGVANLKDDNEQDTSDMRPQRRIRREVNQKDDREQDASSDVAPTQGGSEGGRGDAMEDGDSWGGDGQNEYDCGGGDDGDLNSEEGKQSHVVPDEIATTAGANDVQNDSEIQRLAAELKDANNTVDTYRLACANGSD